MTKRRKSKLDPFLDRIGVLSDREVAALAGVTAENVRAWRKRRGVPASWRGETDRKSAVKTPGSASPSPGRPGRPRAPAPGTLVASAWIVTVEREGGAEEFVVLAVDVAEAAGRAMERLGRGPADPGTIRTISFLAHALLA
ncbi:MAG: hypothetical protein JXB39_13610 [Deltaproteobacteria bacterium]|nr:hypothetical protein [Deltaproteobacteria bacterium]